MISNEWAQLLGRKGVPQIIESLAHGSQRPKNLLEISSVSRPGFYAILKEMLELKLVRPTMIVQNNRGYQAYEFTSDGYVFAEHIIKK